jgi:rhomboid protease GluP
VQNYNCSIIKRYLKSARVTVGALAVVWVAYIIECLYTWVNLSFQYGFANIHPVTLVKMGGNVAELVRRGQIYRLVTATVLHAGIMHIFMNSASLIAFCAEVEIAASFKLYLLVFVIGGIQGKGLGIQGTC